MTVPSPNVLMMHDISLVGTGRETVQGIDQIQKQGMAGINMP